MATIMQVYDILQKTFSKEDAKIVTDFFESNISYHVTENSKHLATKQDVNDTRLDIEKLHTAMEQGFRKQQWSIIALLVPLYIGFIGIVITFFSLFYR